MVSVEEKEAFLLGKKRVDKLIEQGKTSEELTAQFSTTNVAVYGTTANTWRDTQAKIREDPLLAIKRREQMSLQAVLSNPLQLKKIKEMQKKAAKASRSGHHSEDGSSGSDADQHHKKKKSKKSKSKGEKDHVDSKPPRSTRDEQVSDDEPRYGKKILSRDRSRSPHRSGIRKDNGDVSDRRRSVDRSISPSSRDHHSHDRNGHRNGHSRVSHRDEENRLRHHSRERYRSDLEYDSRRREDYGSSRRENYDSRRREDSRERYNNDRNRNERRHSHKHHPEPSSNRHHQQISSDPTLKNEDLLEKKRLEKEMKLKAMMSNAKEFEQDRNERVVRSKEAQDKEERLEMEERMKKGKGDSMGDQFLRDLHRQVMTNSSHTAADMIGRNRAYAQREGEFL